MAGLFWGVQVRPVEPYVHEPSADRRLRITQAMLGSFGDGWSVLHCKVGNRNPVRICALNPMKELMCHLELEFQEKENVVFSVSGISSVHLSGFYTHSDNADQAHSSKKENMADGNNDAFLKDPITEDDGKNGACLKGPILGKGDSTNDISMEGPTLTETDGKNGSILKDRVVADTGGMNDASLKSPIVTEADGKNYDPPKGPIITEADSVNESSLRGPIAEADGKNDASLKEPIDAEVDVCNNVSLKKPRVSEDEHLSIHLAYSKRMDTKKRKCKSMRMEQVQSDQNNMGQVDDQNDCKILDFNVVVSTQDHEIEQEGNIFKSGSATSPTKQSGTAQLPVPLDFSKRRAAEKEKCKTLSTEQVLNDEKSVTEHVKEPKTLESSSMHAATPEAHEIAQGHNAAQNVCQKKIALGTGGQNYHNDQMIGQTDPRITFPDEGYKEAEIFNNIHAGGVPVHKETLDNGLIKEDLEIGDPDGKTASDGKEVYVKYFGMLKDGKVVDPPTTDGFKFKLGAGRVIRGWDLGIHGMHVGGKRRLTIPPALGYGNEGLEEKGIPANSWLIYYIELTKVKKLKKASAKRIKKEPQASVN